MALNLEKQLLFVSSPYLIDHGTTTDFPSMELITTTRYRIPGFPGWDG